MTSAATPNPGRRMLVTIHHGLDRNSGAPGTSMAFADVARARGFEVDLLSHDDLPNRLGKGSELK